VLAVRQSLVGAGRGSHPPMASATGQSGPGRPGCRLAGGLLRPGGGRVSGEVACRSHPGVHTPT
jgi:hypothetical protein